MFDSSSVVQIDTIQLNQAAPAVISNQIQSFQINSNLAGLRLDQALAQLLPEFSRGRIQQWITTGLVIIDGKNNHRCRDKLRGNEQIQLQIPSTASPSLLEPAAQSLALDIIYEDEHLLIINKPAGLVVHPAAGNPDGTLQNALLYYAPELAGIPRAGIVHRLDKDTSGLLVIARTLTAHKSLVNQIQQRKFVREYQALVLGEVLAGGRISAPIGRHPTQRTKMAVVNHGREAITNYRILERYPGYTLLKINLETGRTHQIRVHLAHQHYPIVGDAVYGGRTRSAKGNSAELMNKLQGFKRQALHAIKLGLQHPHTGEFCNWTSPLTPDFAELLILLRRELKN